MKQADVTIGIVPVMIALYKRLVPSLKDKLNHVVSKLTEELADYNIKVIFSDVSSTISEIKKSVGEICSQNIDILIIGNVAYCESGLILEALRNDVDLPILLWPIQEMYEVVADDFDVDTLLVNHGVHGTQDIANVLGRNDIAFGVIHGHWKQKKFVDELREWAFAGRIIDWMRCSNPIQVGNWFDNMLDLQIEGAAFMRKLGLKVMKLSADEFAELTQGISQMEIDEIVCEYNKEFEIADDVDEKLLRKSARNEYALRKIISEHKSFAVGINFLSLANKLEIADALHVAASRLMAEQIGYGGEGDFITAMLVRGLFAISDEVTFTEIFSVDYANNRLVLKHWGEANVNVARSLPAIVKSNFRDEIESEFVISDFEFKCGRVALVNLNADERGAGTLIVIPGTITEQQLPKLTGLRAVFKPDVSDIVAVLDRYASLGGAHHLAMIYIDSFSLEIFQKVSRLSNWKLYIIGNRSQI